MSDTAEHPDVHRQQTAPADTQRSSLRRVPLAVLLRALGEIGIVTVGILIAFALDAWWDNRTMARQEQIHLRALASDFEQNVERLRGLVELEQRVASSSHELLLRAQGRNSGSSESLAALVGNVFNSARYEPVMGAYEALVNSAGLTLIRDDALRASLAQFAARAEDRYAENWSNEHYFAFAREFGGALSLGFHAGKAQAGRERELEELLQQPSFQRHLAQRHYSELDMARAYGELLRQAEAVLSQVRVHIRQ